MGGALSKTTTCDNKRNDFFRYIFVNNVVHYYAYNEYILYSFEDHNLETINPPIKSEYSVDMLTSLVVGCSKQIGDLNNVIEAIASNPEKFGNKFIAKLNGEFKSYLNLAYLRKSSFESYFNFSPTLIIDKEMQKQTKLNHKSMIKDVLNVFSSLKYIIINNKSVDMNFIIVQQFFNSLSLTNSFSPPTNDYYVKSEGTTSILNSYKVCPRGITSNGTFLFVITGNGSVFIYILGNSCSLSTPIKRSINEMFDKSAFSYASSDYLYVESCKVKYRYSIKDLVSAERDEICHGFKVSSASKSTLIKSSDGASLVKLSKKNILQIYNVNDEKENLIKQSELVYGKNELNKNAPTLVPKEYKNNILVATNGAFIGIVMNLSDNTALFRVFSTITGEHIDDIILENQNIYGVCYDSTNKCYFVMNEIDEAKIVVKVVNFIGSEDPFALYFPLYTKSFFDTNPISILAQSVSKIFIHYVGSYFLPKELVCETEEQALKILEILKDLSSFRFKVPQFNQQITVFIEALAIMLCSYIRKAEKNKDYKLADGILDLFYSIPKYIIFLMFFDNIDYIMHNMNNNKISLVIKLIENVNDSLTLIAFRMIEKSQFLIKIPFNIVNPFSDLIPQTTTVNKLPIKLKSLLIIHQKALVNAVYTMLSKNPFLEIEFIAQKRGDPFNQNPLDNFGDYLQSIVTKLDSIISSASDANSLASNCTFYLFSNLLRSISCLIPYHSIARVATALFSILLSKLYQFISKKTLDVNQNEAFAHVILNLLYDYGMFAATLVMGGGMSEFESKNMWLIRGNINLIDMPDKLRILLSTKLDDIDESIVKFINDGNTTNLYKFKAVMNRKLSQEIQKFDRICLAALCKHSNLLKPLMEDLLNSDMKSIVSHVINIRNHYRKLLQQNKNDEAQNVYTRAIMLLRMDGKFAEKDDILHLCSSFIMSTFEPELISTIIVSQRMRIQTTLTGFGLIEKTYSVNSNPVLRQVLSFALSQIENFEGLGMILRITTLSNQQKEQVRSFFNLIRKQIAETKNSYLSCVAFKFFRDIDMFKELKEEFLIKAIDDYKVCNFKPLFGLIYFLILKYNKLPSNIDISTADPYILSLVAECLKSVKISKRKFLLITKRFFNSKNAITCRVLGRCIINSINTQTNELVVEFIKQLFIFIGCCFSMFEGLDEASEAIYVARELFENNEIRKIIDKVIEETEITLNNDLIIAGINAFIGLMYEPIRKMCNAQIIRHGITQDCIVFQTSNLNKFLCVPIPFSLNEKPKIIDNKISCFIKVVPAMPFNAKLFTHFNFVQQCFSKIDEFQPFVQMLIAQSVAQLCNNIDFCNALTEENISKLGSKMQTFGNVQSILNMVKYVKKMPRLPVNGYFSRLRFKNSPFISHLSPILDMTHDKFDVTINTKNGFKGFIGIVSSPAHRLNTRWDMVGVPNGVHYPSKTKLTQFPQLTALSFSVDPKKKVYFVNGKKLKFPFGELFRVIISCPFNTSLNIVTENAFNVESVNTFNCEAMRGGSTEPIYKIPEWTEVFGDDLPQNLKALPESEVNSREVPKEIKHYVSFQRPPFDVPIHIGFATSASDWIIGDEIRTSLSILKEKANTVSIMRIATKNPERVCIKTLSQLFSLLCAQLEPYSTQSFVKGKFPFRLGKACWNLSMHTMLSNENECKNCLKELCNNKMFVNKFQDELQKLVNDPTVHLIARLQPYHALYKSGNIPTSLFIEQPFTMIAANYYSLSIPNFMIANDSIAVSPLITQPKSNINFSDQANNYDVSVFITSPYTPEWIFGTPFELLILIKNFAHACKTTEDHMKIKMMALDLFNCMSPLISLFVPQLIESLQVLFPPTPLYRDSSYIRRLLLMGSIINKHKVGTLERVYLHEERMYNSKVAKETALHFPEFFDADLPKPKTNIVKMKIPIIDPGALTVNLVSHLQVLRMLMHHYKTLIGFPFWEILPIWCRLSGVFSKEINDYIEPSIIKEQNNIMHFCNPSEVEMRIKLFPRRALPIDTMIAISRTSQFEEPKYVSGKHIRDVIVSTESDIYISLVNNECFWDNFEVDFTFNAPLKESNQELEVDTKVIHDKFISDMKEFAIEWKESDTQELLNVLTNLPLSFPTFATVESIARSSELTKRISPNVVVLKALIIHHFNYIINNAEIPSDLVVSMSNILSLEAAAKQILANFTNSGEKDYPEIIINRKLAKDYILTGEGTPESSLIYQLSTIFRKVKPNKLQCPKIPWVVHFVNEIAIDAGGPARELLTEVAYSIFDPTSQVTYTTPNGREKSSQFIPLMQRSNYEFVFKSIGIYLGIILRHCIPQDLPFAPFVWKYLAGGQITNDDILDVDDTLKKHFAHIRSCVNHDFDNNCDIQWTWIHWNGKVDKMPNHENENVTADMVETYINEYIRLRITEVLPALQEIREGLRENIGFKTHPLLTGPLLSHMAQGSNVITTKQIKAITIVTKGYESVNDPPIRFFFSAFERMNNDQRKSLLRFVTTLTRFPSSNKRFKFKIDKLERSNPDNSLPTASTCFNLLHLPAYTNEDICYERLVTAIQFCGTMENK